MNEPSEPTDSTVDESAASASSAAPPVESSIDVANRPDAAWLDDVQGQIDDVDLVLKCLARDSATMCKTCHDLQSEGALEARSVLARCASTKQPR